MNIKRVATSLAAITIIAGAPVLAFADTTAPIIVNNVSVTPVDLDNGSGVGSVAVNFKNTSNMAATEVIFALDNGGTQFDTFTADGTFAPGVSVEQTFETADDYNASQVKVEEVKFADGSVWAPNS